MFDDGKDYGMAPRIEKLKHKLKVGDKLLMPVHFYKGERLARVTVLKLFEHHTLCEYTAKWHGDKLRESYTYEDILRENRGFCNENPEL